MSDIRAWDTEDGKNKSVTLTKTETGAYQKRALDIILYGKKEDGTFTPVAVTNEGYVKNDITDATVVAEFTPGSVVNVDAYTPTGAFQPATAANQTNGEQKTQIVDSDGNSVEPVENIGITPPSAIVGGVKTLTTAGTAEQLITTSTECQYVVISSLDDNTGLAYIGGSDVDKSTKNGIPIGFVTDSSGVVIPESKIIPIDNANKLYVDVNDDGEGISYVIIT